MSITLLVAVAAASPLVPDRPDRVGRMLGDVAPVLAIEPTQVRPAVDAWLAAGGRLNAARTLLLAGGRRGCTGSCAPALLHAARDARVGGAGDAEAIALVLDVQHDLTVTLLTAGGPLDDAALGWALRRGTALRVGALSRRPAPRPG